jgi:glycosyltransferase involved in cell wall biosynthesis
LGITMTTCRNCGAPMADVTSLNTADHGQYHIKKCGKCSWKGLYPYPTSGFLREFIPANEETFPSYDEDFEWKLFLTRRYLLDNDKVLLIGECPKKLKSRFLEEKIELTVVSLTEYERLKDCPTNQFDAAFLWYSLDYAKNPRELCEITRRVVKSDGYIGLCTRDCGSYLNKQKRANVFSSGHVNFIDRQGLAGLFRDVFLDEPSSFLFDKYGDSAVVTFGKNADEPSAKPVLKPLICVHYYLFNKLDDATGPRGRVSNTVDHLRALNVQADISLSLNPEAEGYDIVHLFHNSWEPQDGLSQLASAKQYGKKVVISTIYMDMSETRFIDRHLGRIFKTMSPSKMDQHLAALARGELQAGPDFRQKMVNYHTWSLGDDQRALFEMADRLLCFSFTEARQISLNLRISMPYSIVCNSASQDVFGHYGPEAFEEEYGVKDFVIAAGHLEWRKNQLMTLYALREHPEIPMVVIGAEGDPEYAELCRNWANKNTLFISQLKHRHLASAFAAGRVHAQISWIEGIALSSIEAAMSGCTPVVADRAGEIEYYAEHGGYANPGSVESIRKSIVSAWKNHTSEVRSETKKYMQGRYTFERAAEQTLAAYRKALGGEH